MIEDEVRLALKAVPESARPPLVWIESGLHERPEKLKVAIQALLDLLDQGAEKGEAVHLPSVRPGKGPAAERRVDTVIEPVEEVRFALGFCGNALNGLHTRHLTLVFPRVDDCISMFLNHGCVREQIPRDTRSYYVTEGWFRHGSSLTQAFEDWVERYGPERAASLRQAMFTGYERFTLIDTKAYEVADCIERSEAYAEDLDLEHRVVSGSVQLLERLFKGERDSEIVVVPAGEEIGFTHLFAAADAEG